ncbi:MAG: hypothetical protein ACKN9I_06215, partial [Alphaproteobacteria bacterium]
SAVSNVLKVFASAESKIRENLSETIKDTWFRTDGDRFMQRFEKELKEQRNELKPRTNPANPQGRQLDAIVERRGR